MAISTADFKNGMCIEHNNKLWTIAESRHVEPGKGGALVRIDELAEGGLLLA